MFLFSISLKYGILHFIETRTITRTSYHNKSLDISIPTTTPTPVPKA